MSKDKLFSKENLVTGIAKLTNPEVLAAAKGLAGYAPDNSLFRSPFFLRLMPSLVAFIRRNPKGQSLLGRILSERLGTFGDYLFVKLSEAAASQETAVIQEAPEWWCGICADPKSSRLGDKIVKILIDNGDIATIVGALVLVHETGKHFEGQELVQGRAFIYKMGEVELDLIRKRLEPLADKEDVTETEMIAAVLAEQEQVKKEFKLAAEIVAASV